MKIAYKLAIVGSIAVAGCSSYQDRQARDEQRYPTYATTGTEANWGTGASKTQPGTANPVATAAANQELVAQVRGQLTQDANLAALAPNIQISSQSGAVTLSGNVTSEQDKQKVEAIVKSTSGVVTVNNQLQVASGSSLSPTPKINGTPALPQPSQVIPTTTDQSSINRLDRTSATNVTSAAGPNTPLSPTSNRGEVSRVYSDKDKVNVQGATEADRTLGQQIAQELRTETAITALLPTIKINVETGKVTLSGTVKSEEQKKKIESAVQRVTGVANIDNQLQVGGVTNDKTAEPATP